MKDQEDFGAITSLPPGLWEVGDLSDSPSNHVLKQKQRGPRQELGQSHLDLL